MDRATRLLRQTLVFLFVNAIWGIVYYAGEPAYDRSLFEIALILIPALILLIGLFPNMFIYNFIGKVSKKSQQASKLGIQVIALIGPIFIFSMLLAFTVDTYTLSQEITSEYLRDRDTWSYILFSIGGGIQILFLIMNIATLLSKSNQPQNIKE